MVDCRFQIEINRFRGFQSTISKLGGAPDALVRGRAMNACRALEPGGRGIRRSTGIVRQLS